MLNQPMMEKLLAMRLQGMVEALKTQEQDRAINELSFLERLSLLVDQQWTWRENQALARRLKAAKLRGPACVEDIDYRTARGLDKTVVRALAKDSAWVRQHENIFVLGPTGVGKSFIASALAQKACRDGYSALYLRAAALLRELALARADGSLRHFLARLGRIDVLVIDDWAMAPLNENERREVWEICEDRYQTRSTILTSQLPISRWHEQIGDPTIADGILDRLRRCRNWRPAQKQTAMPARLAPSWRHTRGSLLPPSPRTSFPRLCVPDAALHPGAAASADSARKTNCSGTPRDAPAGILPTPTAGSDDDVVAVADEWYSNPVVTDAQAVSISVCGLPTTRPSDFPERDFGTTSRARRAEVSHLSCKSGRGLGCGWHLGDLGILERYDLPLVLFLYHNQRWAGLYFPRLVAFLELHVRSGEYHRDIGA